MLGPRSGPTHPSRTSPRSTSTPTARRLVNEDRLSARSINKSLVLLHGIFKLAVRRHGLRTNPVAAAERQPQRRSGDFTVLDPGGVALLATKAENAQDAALYTVAAFTGLRLGELLALRWRDVDFAKRLVHVRRSIVLGVEDTPKSHKVRSVPLIDQAARALDGLSRREHFTDSTDHVFVNGSATTRTIVSAAASRLRSPTLACHRCACTTCPHVRHARRAGVPAVGREGVHGPREHRDHDALRAPRPAARRRRQARRTRHESRNRAPSRAPNHRSDCN